MEEFYRRSTVTYKRYNVFDTVKILNIAQVVFYLEHDVPLVDVKLSKDKKTDKGVLVYYFFKDDTREVFDLWCKNKENK